ncbi:MAG: hypothetical protein IBX40_08895 [Methanosarcinales archaeon]|nr:hypothetical protein [Methanosarcinales archaeon]
MKTKPIKVGLIQLGDFINVPNGIESIKKFMNGNQKMFDFSNIATISSDNLGLPELDNLYYSDQQLYNLIELTIKNNIIQEDIEIIFAVTSLRISEKDLFEKDGNACDDLDFFSVRNIKKKIGIISVTQWMLNYEDKSYRSTKQFVAFNIIPLLCEFILEKSLLHFDFRHCIFDKCWDPDQIISGIKKARISPTSREQLLEGLSHEQIKCLEKILQKVKRPPISEILRHFQENSTINLFLFGIVLSTVVTFFSNIALLPLIFLLIFLGTIFWQYYWPSGKLG